MWKLLARLRTTLAAAASAVTGELADPGRGRPDRRVEQLGLLDDEGPGHGQHAHDGHTGPGRAAPQNGRPPDGSPAPVEGQRQQEQADGQEHDRDGGLGHVGQAGRDPEGRRPNRPPGPAGLDEQHDQQGHGDGRGEHVVLRAGGEQDGRGDGGTHHRRGDLHRAVGPEQPGQLGHPDHRDQRGHQGDGGVEAVGAAPAGGAGPACTRRVGRTRPGGDSGWRRGPPSGPGSSARHGPGGRRASRSCWAGTGGPGR